MTTIAKYIAPKQRATRLYGHVIIEDDSRVAERFSVHRVYFDDLGGMDNGTYNLTAEEAWKVFHDRIQSNAIYGPGTWENYNG